MIKVFEAQLDQLAFTMREERRAELCAFFRRDLAEQTAHLDDAALMERIVLGEQLAARLGVTSERGMSLFSILCVEMGEGFVEIPAFRDFFAMPGTTPDDKVLILVKLMRDRFGGDGPDGAGGA